MTKYAASIPVYRIKQLSIVGSTVHGVRIENPPGAPTYIDARIG